MSSTKSIAVPVKRRGTKAEASAPVTAAISQRPTGIENRQSEARTPVVRATHRYRVGQRLAMAQGSRDIARLAAACQVLALLPSENGALRYRVRSEREGFERVVDERDLSSLHTGLE